MKPKKHLGPLIGGPEQMQYQPHEILEFDASQSLVFNGDRRPCSCVLKNTYLRTENAGLRISDKGTCHLQKTVPRHHLDTRYQFGN
jgi:hypothetical protein